MILEINSESYQHGHSVWTNPNRSFNGMNGISPDKAAVSSIFKWYKGDFTENGTLIDFLNKYSPVKIKSSAEISYLDYDWSLNDWP